jgi:hypothetical protein
MNQIISQMDQMESKCVKYSIVQIVVNQLLKINLLFRLRDDGS